VLLNPRRRSPAPIDDRQAIASRRSLRLGRPSAPHSDLLLEFLTSEPTRRRLHNDDSRIVAFGAACSRCCAHENEIPKLERAGGSTAWVKLKVPDRTTHGAVGCDSARSDDGRQRGKCKTPSGSRLSEKAKFDGVVLTRRRGGQQHQLGIGEFHQDPSFG
jgi:hypothetical protein